MGLVATTVQVSAAAPLVQPTTASVGTVIGTQQVEVLPLNTRRFGALAVLTPGTTNDAFGRASTIGGSPFSETTYIAGGSRDASNSYLVDGIDARNMTVGGFSVQPTPDAVQEFKLQTNIYDAAFGRTAGSTINLVTKPGTNEIHGSVYEFLRNDKLDARSFFDVNARDPVTKQEIPGSGRPKFRRNQFGFAIGGPVRKNKTFYFGNFEALRQVQRAPLGLLGGAIVPTAASKAGNFSSVLTGQTINLCGAGGPSNLNFDRGQLFDPASSSLFNCPAGSAKAGSTILVGQPVPGNIIQNINTIAVKASALYPEPNRPGIPNFVNLLSQPRNDYIFLGRIDHTFSPRDQLYGRYMFGQSNLTLGGAFPGFGSIVYYRGQNQVLGWTHSFGSNLLNEARFGFARNTNLFNCENCPKPPGTIANFGINTLTGFGPAFEAVPGFGLTNFAFVGNGAYVPQWNNDMLETYQDNLTWTHGRHTIVVGADMEFWQSFRIQAPRGPNGQFSFDGRFSSLAGEIPGVGGVSDLADFLMGWPSNASRTFRFGFNYQEGGGYWNYYIQDNIKVSPNFALNLGLRYEHRRHSVDRRNMTASLLQLGPKFTGSGNAVLVAPLPDAQNDALCTDPATSYLLSAGGQCLVASSALRGQFGFTGRTRRTLIFPDNTNFAPRLGISWRPTHSDKLIVHSGFGIFYDLPILNDMHFQTNNPVNAPSQNVVTTFGLPPPYPNFANVFQTGTIPRLDQQFLTLFVDPRNYKTPRYQEWSLGFESQMAQHLAVEVNYIGSHAIHQGWLHLLANQPKPGVGPLQPRRPYPDFGQIINVSNDSSSNYHSLQVKVTKRFSRGLSFLAGYTFGKTIDDEGDQGAGFEIATQDDNNLRANRGRAGFDLRHRFVFSYIWELPFGNGRRFLSTPGKLNVLAGGWMVSGITTLQPGFPVTVTSSFDFSNSGSQSPRPDRLCNGKGAQSISSWFDPSCFSRAALSDALTSGSPRFGNSGRNILDGPGFNNFDFALIKRTRIFERLNSEFRAEFFNLFNHPNFARPIARFGAGNFGRISSVFGSPRDIQFGIKLIF